MTHGGVATALTWYFTQQLLPQRVPATHGVGS